MGFPASWLTVLLVSACTLLARGQDNTQTRIPETLIECYRNQSLRSPENRPPMTIGTFIDIVRKVEKYQGGAVGIAELTTSILHRFRLDGIVRNQDVVEAQGVLPYAVNGVPFFKHRLILKYLVPANNYQFPNESLSQVELCTLHFMLSHSIDTTPRGDESTVCGRLSNYQSGHRVPRNARFRRQVEEDEAAAAAAKQQSLTSEEDKPHEAEDAEQIQVEGTGKGLQSSAEDAEDTPKDVPKDTDLSQEAPQEGDDKSDSTHTQQVEAVNKKTTDSGNGTKSGNYIFDDESGSYNHPQQKARNVADPETDIDVQPRVTVTRTESDCPVESGVVYTKWGTVSLGAVLAGLAAGLYQEDVQLPDLVRNTQSPRNLPGELESLTIDNRFAATLVGDLAEAALEQGPKKLDNIKIGLSGGWNNTLLPRWYFHNEKDGRELTDAEIRGGLDGLVLGTYIEGWKRKLSGTELKLSQLLSMYYSEDGAFETQYRACQRKDLYSAVAPNDKLDEQTFRFAVVLDQQSISSASLDSARVKDFAETAVRKLASYLPAMNDKSCTTRGITPREKNFQGWSLYTNVTVVIDRNWDLQDFQDLIFQLASELELGEYGSRLTVLDGKNTAPFITDATSSIDVLYNITESKYVTHEGGMDIPRALEQELQKSMEGLLQAEAENKLAGARSTVILFILQTPVTLSNNDLTIAKDKINHFREYLPDVKFLYLVPGSKDNYKELADNPTTDIITFGTLTTEEKNSIISQVIDRIKQVPVRLLNPTCGANWTRTDYGTADFSHSVTRLGVKYHRLHPNYFYGAGSAQVTVLDTNSPNLTVCYSRKVEYPDNATTTDVTCKNTQAGEIQINLQNACDGSDYISQCRPLYISVRSGSTPEQFSCSHDCALPTNIEYTIRNQGLDCKAGVGHLLSNPLLMLLAAALILLMKNLNVGS